MAAMFEVYYFQGWTFGPYRITQTLLLLIATFPLCNKLPQNYMILDFYTYYNKHFLFQKFINDLLDKAKTL